MYKLNDIFREDSEYTKRVEFCSQNGFVIVEIDADENGRRFQIQEKPAPTAQQLAQMEYDNLKQQLADMDYKTSKYVDGEYTAEEWQAIVAERQAIRARVRELETTLANV